MTSPTDLEKLRAALTPCPHIDVYTLYGGDYVRVGCPYCPAAMEQAKLLSDRRELVALAEAAKEWAASFDPYGERSRADQMLLQAVAKLAALVEGK